jgi:hypothetical protein
MAIFSGEDSIKFWDMINAAEKDIPGVGVLYEFGCRAQELEAEVQQLRADVDELLKQRKSSAHEITRTLRRELCRKFPNFCFNLKNSDERNKKKEN